MEKTSEELRYIPTIWPTEQDKITSDYGIRTDPFLRESSFHSGLDIRGEIGTPVYAGADGEVTLAEHDGGYGNTIIIEHSDTYETLYGHLHDIHVDTGETVEKGDPIGELGSTGRSTGAHLHYEVLEDSEPIDPFPYLRVWEDGV